MSKFKPFRACDHVNLPEDCDAIPKLINMPPSSGVFCPMREFLDAIVDKYKDGSSDSISIEFRDDGLVVVEKSEDSNSVPDNVRNVQESINDICKHYAIEVEWKEPSQHIYHSTLCKWTVQCVFVVK